jgi:hypothetical protein
MITAVVTHGVKINSANQGHEVVIGMPNLVPIGFKLLHHDPGNLLRTSFNATVRYCAPSIETMQKHFGCRIAES